MKKKKLAKMVKKQVAKNMRSYAQKSEESEEDVKPVTLYLSEEARIFLSVGKASGQGTMSAQVDAIIQRAIQAERESQG